MGYVYGVCGAFTSSNVLRSRPPPVASFSRKDFKGQLLAENLYFYIVILLGVSENKLDRAALENSCREN